MKLWPKVWCLVFSDSRCRYSIVQYNEHTYFRIDLWPWLSINRLRNDLYCVEWGVKLYSNQLQPTARYDHDRTQRDNQSQRYQLVQRIEWTRTDTTDRNNFNHAPQHDHSVLQQSCPWVHFVWNANTHTPGSRNTRGPQEDSEKHLTYNANESQARTTSQTGIVLKRLDESSSFLARRLPSTIPYCVKRKFRYLQ